MVIIQNSTGLPWYVSIAATTCVVRTLLLPLSRQQILASEKLSPSIRDIAALTALFRKHVNARAKDESMFKIAREEVPRLISGYKAILSIREASITAVMAPIAVNVTVFLLFVQSIRLMLENPQYGGQLMHGGISWFSDLTSEDRTMYLPFAAAVINYQTLNIVIPTPEGAHTRTFPLKMKDFFQTLLIISFPALVNFPAGVFMYWIPSGLYSVGQRYLFMNNSFRAMLRMPPFVRPNSSPAQQQAEAPAPPATSANSQLFTTTNGIPMINSPVTSLNGGTKQDLPREEWRRASKKKKSN